MITHRAFYLTLALVALAPFPMTAAGQDSLQLRLDLPSEARIGAPVPITLRVENTSDRSLTVYLRGRTIAFDVIVERDDGRVVWRKLEGEVIPAIVAVKTLGPREVMELHARWDQRTNRRRRVAAGLYSVRGALLTDMPTPLESAAVQLRIVPD